MFRIAEDPSSGSLVQCLAKNYKNGSVVSVDMDMVSVMAAYVCVVHFIGRVPCYTVNYTHTHNGSEYAAMFRHFHVIIREFHVFF